MTTGEKIRAARQKAGMTQKQLGKLCGIAEPTIRRYELDKLNPKRETLQKIAKPLGIYYLDLCSDEENYEFAAFFKAGMKLNSDIQESLKKLKDFDTPVNWVLYLQEHGYEFTEAERQAVSLFNQLEGMTQQMVITDLARLCLNPKHRKDGTSVIEDDSKTKTTQQSPPPPPEGKDTTLPAGGTDEPQKPFDEDKPNGD